MTAHKHAARMLQYAQDAAETDEPWTRWECKGSRYEEWAPFTSTHPAWLETAEYRRKPRPLTYSVTIPEPLREEPPMDTEYYVVSLYEPGSYDVAYWEGCHAERMWLKRGLCFATEADAIAAAKAMCPFKTEGAE